MKKRYTVLDEKHSCFASSLSPALLTASSLINDRFTGNYIAMLKFLVTEPVNLIDFTVELHCLDTAGREYDSPVVFTYSQISKCRDDYFGADTAVILGQLPVTEYYVVFKEAICSGKEIRPETDEPDSFTEIKSPESLDAHFDDPELSRQFIINYGSDCKNFPFSSGRYWYCACGAINNGHENSCHLCKRSYAALSKISADSLKADAAIRVREEEAEAEAMKAEKAKKRSALKKFIPVIIPVVIVAVILAGTIPGLVRKEKAYSNAQQLLAQNNFDEAEKAFSELGNYRSSADYLNNEIVYRKALFVISGTDAEDNSILALAGFSEDDFSEPYLLKQALYSYASELLSGLPAGYHNDVSDKITYCNSKIEEINFEHLDNIYTEACTALNNGEYTVSSEIFKTISGFKDSEELQKDAMYQRASAAYDIISSYRCEGVYADFHGDSANVLITLSKNTAFRLGDGFITDVRDAFGSEGLKLEMTEQEPEGFDELCSVVCDEFRSLSGYKDSDSFVDLCVTAADYTLEFRQLVAEGKLSDAKIWLEAYDGKFDSRDEWISKLDTYIPFCADYYFISGDNTLLPLTQDINTTSNNISAYVVINEDTAELHLIDEVNDVHVVMTASVGEVKFMYSSEYSNYVCIFTVQGRLGYIRYDTYGNMVGSAEYYYS